ncbi:MAG: hypothetical protein DRI57_16505 [Deltaproteobacteria bacterium]|nr:MAG: hypothetical protein DRI57_16505 [Deltaproteobacteria bacterium]
MRVLTRYILLRGLETEVPDTGRLLAKISTCAISLRPPSPDSGFQRAFFLKNQHWFSSMGNYVKSACYTDTPVVRQPAVFPDKSGLFS